MITFIPSLHKTAKTSVILKFSTQNLQRGYVEKIKSSYTDYRPNGKGHIRSITSHVIQSILWELHRSL